MTGAPTRGPAGEPAGGPAGERAGGAPLAERLADFAVRAHAAGLDAGLREEAARRVLDTLGNCLAATPRPEAETVRAVALEWAGPPVATCVGSPRRLPPAGAALVNGTLAHALDFDDTHLPSVLHPSAPVVPAALAAAEAAGAGGAAFLDAVVIGVELTVRLGMAGYDSDLGNSVFFEHGFHATAICGTIGAAVAAALLRAADPGTGAGTSADTVAAAIGIAASMGAGLLEANRTGGTVKRVHCGWAAHCGIAAADLARHGLTGPPTVLEGRFGFLRAYCGDRARPEALTAGLGTDWEYPGLFVKPYPCNHFTHAGIDAALRLRAGGVRASDVEEIELGVAAPVLRTIAEPAAEKARPRSGYHAAFSGPYTVAAALLGGGGLGVSHEDFTDAAARDPDRLALAARVRCVADPWCAEIFPNQFPAVLRVRTRDGRWIEHRVAANRGGPGNPLSDPELAAKFHLNAAAGGVTAEREEAVVAAVRALPHGAPLAPLTTALRG